MKKYTYIDDKLVDDNGFAVMMGWERPIMQKVAEILCEDKGDVLNIGFGMGIVDTYIQELKPKSHTIIECHPDVINKMIEEGWPSKSTCIFSTWQEQTGKLGLYDSIYMDTWADMRKPDLIYDFVNTHLKKGGIFSIWYNETEFNYVSKKFGDNYNIEFVEISNDDLIPQQQHQNGKHYIEPNNETILIPIIRKEFE
jgi:hypothetical protein